MKIPYTIRVNKMMGKDEYAAMVRPIFTADLEQVVERMLQQSCAIGKAAILGVLEMFFTAIERMVLEGIYVTTPLVNVHPSITGTFQGCDDHFDRRRHRIEARVTPGRRLRRVVRIYGRAEKEPTRGHPAPFPLSYVDLESGQRNSTVTPGGMGRLTGGRLKFDRSDPRQGIFFVAADGSARRVEQVAESHPRQAIFVVPQLPAGPYILEVRAQAEDSEDVRCGRLYGAQLAVANTPTLEPPHDWIGQRLPAAVEELS